MLRNNKATHTFIHYRERYRSNGSTVIGVTVGSKQCLAVLCLQNVFTTGDIIVMHGEELRNVKCYNQWIWERYILRYFTLPHI